MSSKTGQKGFSSFLENMFSKPSQKAPKKQEQPQVFTQSEIKLFPQKPQGDADLMALLTKGTNINENNLSKKQTSFK